MTQRTEIPINDLPITELAEIFICKYDVQNKTLEALHLDCIDFCLFNDIYLAMSLPLLVHVLYPYSHHTALSY